MNETTSVIERAPQNPPLAHPRPVGLVMGILASVIAGLLVTRVGPRALLLIPVLLIGWRVIHNPIWALSLYLVSVPLSTASEALVGISITKLVFVVLVLSWLLGAKGRLRARETDIPLWGALFVVVCFAASIVSKATLPGLANTARLGGYVLLVIISADLLPRPGALKKSLYAILVPSLPFVILGIYQFVTHGTILGLGLHRETGDFVVWKGFVQASGVFDHPNVFATYLLVYLCLATGLGLQAERLRDRLFFFGLASLSFGGLLVTFSRSGWVGLMASAGAFVLIYPRFLKAALVLLLILVLLVLVLPEKQAEGLTKRTRPEMDDSMRARVGAYKSAWRMFVDHPLLGVGLGSFNRRFLEYKAPDARFPKNYIRGSAKGMEAHSTYLQLLAETGILGLAAFFALNFSVAFQLVRLLRRHRDGFARGLAIGLAAAFVGLVVQNAFNSQEYIKAFWVVIALIAGLSQWEPQHVSESGI